MNILIADDSQLDRTALKDSISEIYPDCAIWEASSIKQLFSELTGSWDLLFLDISFSGNYKPDEDGFFALLEIVNSYPALPVCIVTGHYIEKLPKFIQQFLGTTLQVINFLDKSNYSDDNIERTIEKAHEYQLKFKKNIEDKHASDDLILEVAEEAKHKFMTRALFELHDRLSHADTLKTAFTGDDWSGRIEAEGQLTNGMCKVNAALLCIEMDRLIQALCPPEGKLIKYYHEKLNCIAKHFNIGWLDQGLMHEGWDTRNEIVHANMVADRDDAYLLLKCIRLLSRNRPKNKTCKKGAVLFPAPGPSKTQKEPSEAAQA